MHKHTVISKVKNNNYTVSALCDRILENLPFGHIGQSDTIIDII